MHTDLENFRVFLLFSADGFNEYSYKGLTSNKEEAYTFYKSPLSYVVLVSPSMYKVLAYEEQWKLIDIL